MRWIFDIAWLALLAFMASSLAWLPEQVGDPGKTMHRLAYLSLMLPIAVLVPWLCTRGMVWLARRHPQAMNLPNKDYWLADERREASLARLGESSWGLGLSIVLLLAIANYSVFQGALPEWPRLETGLLMALIGLQLACTLAWTFSLYKRFPAPPRSFEPRSLTPRRPRR